MDKKPTYNASGDEIKNTSYDDMAETSNTDFGFGMILIFCFLLVLTAIAYIFNQPE